MANYLLDTNHTAALVTLGPSRDRVVFTPKGSYSAAQGRSRSDRTLGVRLLREHDPERVRQLRILDMWNPFGVHSVIAIESQGALASRATLGFVMKRLRRKGMRQLAAWL